MRFTEDEKNALIDGVSIMGTGCWAAILQRYKDTFQPGRTSVHLKDKWRNLVTLAQKKRADRGTNLSREQAVKILEVLHLDPDEE